MNRFVQQFDSVPQFWQFVRGLRFEDLLVELIQNELDANASHTSISFMPDRLVCHGDGESVSEDGWRRLSFIAGAGDQVEAKRFRIGVKNHGLKACFRLGDEIILRSDGRKMIQTLYKDGYESQPSPGALPEPDPDDAAPPVGCSVEVPYRRKDLIVPKGESLTLGAPDEKLIDKLFRDACKLLPGRLMGGGPSKGSQSVLTSPESPLARIGRTQLASQEGTERQWQTWETIPVIRQRVLLLLEYTLATVNHHLRTGVYIQAPLP